MDIFFPKNWDFYNLKNNWGRGGCSFSPEMGRDMEPFIKGIGGFPIDNYKKWKKEKIFLNME